MIDETTQALLQRLQDNVTNYDPKEWDGVTKDELQTRYEIFKHVSETLTCHELSLLWYLRTAAYGETYRFMRVAKQLSEAHQAFLHLRNGCDVATATTDGEK